jgi:hypothetical protein
MDKIVQSHFGSNYKNHTTNTDTLIVPVSKRPMFDYNVRDFLLQRESTDSQELYLIERTFNFPVVTPFYEIVVSIDSRERLPTENCADYILQLPNTYNVYAIELVHVGIIGNPQYTVYSGNNVLLFQETPGITLQVSLEPGNYDYSTFASALQTALNTMGNSNYTVSVHSTTGIITIASDQTGGTGIFTIFKSSSMFQILGFLPGADLIDSGSYTSRYQINLAGERTIELSFKNVSVIEPFMVPLDSDNFYGMNDPYVFRGPSKFLNNLHIQLKNPNGTYYEFNGLEHNILLKLKCINK